MPGLRKLNDVLQGLTGRRLMRPPGVGAAQRQTFATGGQLQALQRGETYARLAQLDLRHRLPATDEVDLRTAELKVYSQNGEDGIIDALRHALKVDDFFFVEFGVEDGSECNTRLLAEVFGWGGVYIEPVTGSFSRLATRYRGSPRIGCVNEAVTPENVNELFRASGVPEIFGVLSIDVDGQDYWIWEALSPDYRPAIVVVEYNSAFAPGATCVELRGTPWSDDFSDTFGASIHALRLLAGAKGYTLVHTDVSGANAFFADQEILSRSGVNLVGLSDRSPNYYLQGHGHPIGAGRTLTDVSVVTGRE